MPSGGSAYVRAVRKTIFLIQDLLRALLEFEKRVSKQGASEFLRVSYVCCELGLEHICWKGHRIGSRIALRFLDLCDASVVVGQMSRG